MITVESDCKSYMHMDAKQEVGGPMNPQITLPLSIDQHIECLRQLRERLYGEAKAHLHALKQCRIAADMTDDLIAELKRIALSTDTPE